MYQLFVLCLLLATVNAFMHNNMIKRSSSSLNMAFDLDKAVNTLSRNRILTKTAELGLLSRLEKAGFTLTTAKPLLKLADDKDILGYLEASSDDVLSLAATAIEFAPAVLPLAGTALKAGPTPLFLGAAASAGAAYGLYEFIPDDSILNVALQTSAVGTLGVLVPGALTVGGGLLATISK